MKKKLQIITAAIALTAVTTSCGSREEIQIDGSSTVYPVTEAIAEEYRKKAPDVRVTIGVSGTGGGFKKFVRGDIDINDASRSIKPSEKKICEENNIDYVELSVAYDGLAVIVNPENEWVENISVKELKMIWEPDAQGKITKWSHIREEWPDEEIHLYGPGVASGTYDYFTKAIVGESGASRGDFTASEDDNVLVQGVSTDKYALGFFGLAYYEENAEKLKLLGVDNGENTVKPSQETVGNGTYSPLSRPIFIYISNKASNKEAVQKFVDFYMDNAGSIAKEVGYIPLPDAKYKEEKAEFHEFVESHAIEKEKAK